MKAAYPTSLRLNFIMAIAAKQHTKCVYVLQQTDEMRHPYETALHALDVKLEWVPSLPALVSSAARKDLPVAIVVDLDCLSQPLEGEFATLMVRKYKGPFPASRH